MNARAGDAHAGRTSSPAARQKQGSRFLMRGSSAARVPLCARRDSAGRLQGALSHPWGRSTLLAGRQRSRSSSNSAASGHWRGRMSLLLQSRSSSLDVRFRCSSQGRSAGVGGRRARSREGGRRVLSRWSPPHRAFIGRVLRDTRRRLHRERLPYAGGVPARGSLPYAASAWRGGQPALGVA
jgi:hypothetical protein